MAPTRSGGASQPASSVRIPMAGGGPEKRAGRARAAKGASQERDVGGEGHDVGFERQALLRQERLEELAAAVEARK